MAGRTLGVHVLDHDRKSVDLDFGAAAVGHWCERATWRCAFKIVVEPCRGRPVQYLWCKIQSVFHVGPAVIVRTK